MFRFLLALQLCLACSFASAEIQGSEQSIDEVLLFDGECVLCDFFVGFVVGHDYWNKAADLWLAPLQSPIGQRLLTQHELPLDIQSVVYVDQRAGTALLKSTAVAMVLGRMSAPWPLFGWLVRLFPLGFRDHCYDIVASNRYQWFGSKELLDGSCPVSDSVPDLEQRILRRLLFS